MHTETNENIKNQNQEKEILENTVAGTNLSGNDKRKELERKVVAKMIQIYCKKHHKAECQSVNAEHLCDECAKLLKYAQQRINECHYSKNKPFCSSCKIHCYEGKMRERIRTVMRYSGSRMILHCPILAIKHLCDRIRN